MNRSYYEDLYRADQRDAEWHMLNRALRQRRRHAFRRSLIAVVFWTLGIR
ncbi:hypothetical protein EKD04_006730 [Chloroflexales bacterium ZM16-3]|nr:hypothetical protein [Chloroflexales bacterium ZM16-3]